MGLPKHIGLYDMPYQTYMIFDIHSEMFRIIRPPMFEMPTSLATRLLDLSEFIYFEEYGIIRMDTQGTVQHIADDNLNAISKKSDTIGLKPAVIDWGSYRNNPVIMIGHGLEIERSTFRSYYSEITMYDVLNKTEVWSKTLNTRAHGLRITPQCEHIRYIDMDNKNLVIYDMENDEEDVTNIEEESRLDQIVILSATPFYNRWVD